MGYEKTLLRLNQTLLELRTDYLDVALIHRPNNAAVEKVRKVYVDRELRLSTWQALQKARQLGIIRYAGVSNFGEAYLNELSEAGLPRPAVNELEFNPLVSPEQRDLVQFCHDNGIAVVGYNSLGGQRAQRGALAKLGSDKGVSEVQLLLRYSLEHNVGIIPTSGSENHIRDNLEVGKFSLAPSELTRIEQSFNDSAKFKDFRGMNDPHLRQGLLCESAKAYVKRLSKAMSDVRKLSTPVRRLDVHGWPVEGLCAEEYSSPATARLLGGLLQRSHQPFVVLPGFVGEDDNQQMLKDLRSRYPLPHRPKTHCNIHDDGVANNKRDGDMRCENKKNCDIWSDTCRKYMNDSFLQTFVDSFYGKELPEVARKGWRSHPRATIASLVRGRGANSGGTWHQDENARATKANLLDQVEQPDVVAQVKCLAYHASTRSENAPFTMLVDYNGTDMLRHHLAPPGFDKKRRRYRYTSETIQNVSSSTDAFVLELIAPAGSMICFEAGSIHHGKELVAGDRYSMTVYFSEPGPEHGFYPVEKFPRGAREKAAKAAAEAAARELRHELRDQMRPRVEHRIRWSFWKGVAAGLCFIAVVRFARWPFAKLKR